MNIGSLTGEITLDDAMSAVLLKIDATMKQFGQTTQASMAGVEQSMMKANIVGSFLGNTFATMALQAVSWVKNIVTGSIQAGLRLEQLQVATRFLGEKAGYTAGSIDALADKIEKTGISGIAARQSIQSLLGANIDLKYATELSTIAQNMQSLSGKSSSDVFQIMTRALATGNTELLRGVGFQTISIEALKRGTDGQTKYKGALVGSARSQMILNAILAEGKDKMGLYAESMTTAGKQASSAERAWDQVSERLGTILLPITATATKAWYKLGQAVRDSVTEASVGMKSPMEKIGEMLQAAINKTSDYAVAGVQAAKDLINWWTGLPQIFRDTALGAAGLATALWLVHGAYSAIMKLSIVQWAISATTWLVATTVAMQGLFAGTVWSSAVLGTSKLLLPLRLLLDQIAIFGLRVGVATTAASLWASTTAAIGGMFTAFVGVLTTVGTAIGAFLTAPIGLVIGALALLTGGIRIITGSWEFLLHPMRLVGQAMKDAWTITKDLWEQFENTLPISEVNYWFGVLANTVIGVFTSAITQARKDLNALWAILQFIPGPIKDALAAMAWLRGTAGAIEVRNAPVTFEDENRGHDKGVRGAETAAVAAANATKRTAEELEAARKAAEAYQKKLDDLRASILRGSDATKVFAEIFGKLTPAQLASEAVLKRLVPEIEKYAAAGGVLNAAMIATYNAGQQALYQQREAEDLAFRRVGLTKNQIEAEMRMGKTLAEVAVTHGLVVGSLERYMAAQEEQVTLAAGVATMEEALRQQKLKGEAYVTAEYLRNREAIFTADAMIAERQDALWEASSEGRIKQIQDATDQAIANIRLEGDARTEFTLRVQQLADMEIQAIRSVDAAREQAFQLDQTRVVDNFLARKTATDRAVDQINAERAAALDAAAALNNINSVQWRQLRDEINAAADELIEFEKELAGISTASVSLDKLSAAFTALADVSGESFGSFLKSLATLIATLKVAEEAGNSMRRGIFDMKWAFREGGGGARAFAQGLADVAAGAISAYAAMNQATQGITNTTEAMLRGAAAGAQAGSAFGIWGTVIGGVIGALTGAANASAARAAAFWAEQRAIAAVGLTMRELIQYNTRLVNDLSRNALGEYTLALGLTQGSFGDSLALATERARLFTEALKRIHDEMSLISREGGIATKALIDFRNAMPTDPLVMEFVLQEVQRAGALTGGALNALQYAANAKRAARIKELEARDSEDDPDVEDELTRLKKQIEDGVNATIKLTATGAKAMASILLAAYDGTAESLRNMQPALLTLQASMAAAGISGGAAFDTLIRLAGIASSEITGPAIDAIDMMSQSLSAMYNSGFLTQDMFSGIVDEIMAQRQALIDSGASAADVDAIMQPSLQRIWQLHVDSGLAIDDETQKLIDQGLAQGTIGDRFRSSTDRMVIALERLADMFETVFGDKLEDEARRGADAAQRELDRIRGRSVVVTVEYNDPGWPGQGGGGQGGQGGGGQGGGGSTPNPPPGAYTGGYVTSAGLYMSQGGRVPGFTPKGTDTVPAMLTPGEQVLSVAQAEQYRKGGKGGTVVVEISGREWARMMVPELAEEVRRQRLGGR